MMKTVAKVTIGNGEFEVDRMGNGRPIHVLQLRGGNLQALLSNKWWFRREDGGGMNGYDRPQGDLKKLLGDICRRTRNQG